MQTTLQALALAAAALCGLPAAAAPQALLRAEGSEWVLGTAQGELRSAQLTGAELRLAGGARIRIDAVQAEVGAQGRRLWAHELSVLGPDSRWQPLCAAHSDGTHYAVVLPGSEQPDGSLAEDADHWALSCTSGALAKCLRMGYEPWQRTAQGQPMRAVYNACIRMVRADYGGQGRAYTENGQQIDVYDDFGVQQPDTRTDQHFEAGWNEQGAVCVHHLRVPGKVTPEELEQRHPQLRGQVGEICTEAHARSLGALVFNRSNDRSAR